MDKVRFVSNERVDQADIDAITENVVQDQKRHNVGVLSATAGPVFSGFSYDIIGAPNATTLQITRGAALLSEGGVPSAGQLTSEGLTTQTVSFSGLAVATHSVWVRFTYTAGVAGNRVIWDANAAEEAVANISTRDVAGWQITIAQTQPAPEWEKLLDVAWDGSGLETSTITDQRQLFFEGGGEAGADFLGAAPVLQNPLTAYPSSWGGGSDRDNDRGVNGVTDLREFCAAVLQKLEEIQTGTNTTEATHRWWEVPAHGSLDDMLPLTGSVDASTRVRGDIEPDILSGRALGSAGRRWTGHADTWTFYAGGGIFASGGPVTIGDFANPFDEIYAEEVNVRDSLIMEAGSRVDGNLIPVVTLNNDLGSAVLRWDGIYADDLFLTDDITIDGVAPDLRMAADAGNTIDFWRGDSVSVPTIFVKDVWDYNTDKTIVDYTGEMAWRDAASATIIFELRQTVGGLVGTIGGATERFDASMRNVDVNGTLKIETSVNGNTCEISSVNTSELIFDFGTYQLDMTDDGWLDFEGANESFSNSTPYNNVLNVGNLPKAWASIDTAGTITVLDGFNITSANILGGPNGPDLRVVFTQAMLDTNYCVVPVFFNQSGSAIGGGFHVQVFDKQTGEFTLHIDDDAGTNEDWNTTDYGVDIIVFGRHGA